MRIEKNLNIVLPVEYAAGTVYVHSEPISVDVFERYAIVVAKAFAEIYNGGLNVVAGPRVAMIVIRQIAKSMDPEGSTAFSEDVEAGLIAEIKRLSNVVAPKTGGGWEPIPFDEALSRGILDRSDLSEVENVLAFFTVASRMHKRKELPAVAALLSRIWDAQTTSLNCTEYSASLTTSTGTANTGGTAAA